MHNIHTTRHIFCRELVNEFHKIEWMVSDENDRNGLHLIIIRTEVKI